ncbi:hypothetical protein BDW66DRAFT_125540 [Aspergillus desertorum]
MMAAETTVEVLVFARVNLKSRLVRRIWIRISWEIAGPAVFASDPILNRGPMSRPTICRSLSRLTSATTLMALQTRTVSCFRTSMALSSQGQSNPGQVFTALFCVGSQPEPAVLLLLRVRFAGRLPRVYILCLIGWYGEVYLSWDGIGYLRRERMLIR